MNIAKKIKVFLSVKEQMSCLRDPKYIRYDDDIYSEISQRPVQSGMQTDN